MSTCTITLHLLNRVFAFFSPFIFRVFFFFNFFPRFNSLCALFRHFTSSSVSSLQNICACTLHTRCTLLHIIFVFSLLIYLCDRRCCCRRHLYRTKNKSEKLKNAFFFVSLCSDFNSLRTTSLLRWCFLGSLFTYACMQFFMSFFAYRASIRVLYVFLPVSLAPVWRTKIFLLAYYLTLLPLSNNRCTQIQKRRRAHTSALLQNNDNITIWWNSFFLLSTHRQQHGLVRFYFPSNVFHVHRGKA